MTGRNQKTVYGMENDIEKNREDGNWNRMIEIADMLMKSKRMFFKYNEIHYYF